MTTRWKRCFTPESPLTDAELCGLLTSPQKSRFMTLGVAGRQKRRNQSKPQSIKRRTTPRREGRGERGLPAKGNAFMERRTLASFLRQTKMNDPDSLPPSLLFRSTVICVATFLSLSPRKLRVILHFRRRRRLQTPRKVEKRAPNLNLCFYSDRLAGSADRSFLPSPGHGQYAKQTRPLCQ